MRICRKQPSASDCPLGYDCDAVWCLFVLAALRRPDNGCWQDLEITGTERAPLISWSCSSMVTLWGVTELTDPRRQSCMPPVLDGEPALLPLRGQAAGEGGDLLLGDILPPGPGVV